MSIKKLLDFVEQKLLEQGRPSINDDGSCLYRHSDGLKCGIGFLIPDALYCPSMEGITAAAINSKVHEHIRAEYSFPAEFNLSRLLDDVQDVHDNHSGSPTFNKDLKLTFEQLNKLYSTNPHYN